MEYEDLSENRRARSNSSSTQPLQASRDRSSSSNRRQNVSNYPASSSTAPVQQTQSAQNADLARMGDHANNTTTPQPMRNIMQELYEVGTRTALYPNSGGAAYTSRRYRDGNFPQQESHYQGHLPDEAKRLGNLTHELTHASVQEHFSKDYVNYTNSPRVLVDAPAFNQSRERMENELVRQNQQRVPSADNAIRVKLEKLQELTLKDKHLTKEQRTEVRDKLTYGLQNPHIEFDTVINQILSWLHSWGVRSGASKLMKELESVAAKNYTERMAGNRIVPPTNKQPTLKPSTKTIGEKPSSWKDVFRRS